MIGVRNPKKLTPQSTDDGLAKCAEVWVNELRLTGFDNSGGEAATGRVTAKLADFAQVSLSGKYTSVGWGSIDKNVLGRNRESDKSYDFQSSLELGKFFGDNARVRIPFYFQQSEQWKTPQFDPLDPDVEFGRSLDNKSSEEQRDTLERIAQDYTLVRSFNFTNVRKERSQNSRRKVSLPWDIENFTASYSFSQNYRRNISTVYSNRDDFRANLTYAYNVRPILVEPFRKVKFLQNKWLALIRDFNFYFYPSRFSVRGDVVSSYHVQQMRNTDNLSILLPVTYNKSYTFNRTWDLAFDLAKSLKLDYNSRMNTWIDELDGPRDSDSVRASIRDSWSRFGRPTQFQQTVNASWELPIKKIPILDFVNITTRYTGTFNWQTNSLQALQSDTLNFGNTIQNSANIQFNGTLNMTTLYNKWRYFRDLNKAKPKNPPGPARRNPGEVDALGENGKRSKNGFVREVLDVFAGILISVKNLSLNYSNNRGTMMPGFLGTPTYFGLDNNLGQAPGIPFVFGIQEDIRPAAAENGWITTSKYQNNPYTTTLAENISVRGTIEPLPQFRIELSATRTWSESYMEFFRFNDTTGMFESQNPMRSGNLSLTFFSLPTAFEVSPAPGFPSANFDQFLANRIVISERLAQQRAAEDPNYNPVLVGNPDSANFGYDGFSVTNSDVLIFAFLSAYGGEDPEKSKLNFRQRLPLPNWRLTYDGLMNIGMFKRAFTNFSITHGYRSLYNLSSYVDNLIRQQRIADGETDPRDDKGDFLTEFQVAAITITEQFSPLIGFNARMKNSFTARAEFNRDRTLNLSLANNQLTEIKGNELIVGFGYIIKDLKFNLIRTGANKKPVVSNLELKVDVSIRDNQTVIRKIVEQFSQVTSGQTVVGVKFQADYAISQRVTTSFFYDQLINRYKVSNAFPTNAINVGFRVRLNLGN
jgi:cell surface protein SprA